MLRGFYRFHRFIGSPLKKITQPTDKQPMTTNLAETTKADLAAEVDRLRAENTELAARPCLACATLPTPADVAALRAALQQADRLLDGAIRQRAIARDTDPVARMQADEGWPHYLKAVDKWRKNTLTLAQKRA